MGETGWMIGVLLLTFVSIVLYYNKFKRFGKFIWFKASGEKKIANYRNKIASICVGFSRRRVNEMLTSDGAYSIYNSKKYTVYQYSTNMEDEASGNIVCIKTLIKYDLDHEVVAIYDMTGVSNNTFSDEDLDYWIENSAY